MRKKALFIVLLALSSSAQAGYLDRLHDLDQQLICAISYFIVPVAAVMFLLGGLLMMTEDPEKKSTGKAVAKNALLGLLLVICFILISIALMPTITLSACV